MREQGEGERGGVLGTVVSKACLQFLLSEEADHVKPRSWRLAWATWQNPVSGKEEGGEGEIYLLLTILPALS